MYKYLKYKYIYFCVYTERSARVYQQKAANSNIYTCYYCILYVNAYSTSVSEHRNNVYNI